MIKARLRHDLFYVILHGMQLGHDQCDAINITVILKFDNAILDPLTHYIFIDIELQKLRFSKRPQQK